MAEQHQLNSWYYFIDSIVEDEGISEGSYSTTLSGVSSLVEDLLRKAFDAGYTAAEKKYK